MDFRLLVPVVGDNDGGGPILLIDNEKWSLTSPLEEPNIPPYVCVSYVWGAGRKANPLHAGMQMSDRTLPALTAAIRSPVAPKAVWMDAFCIPPERGASRTATLESMGYIYGNADCVVVVLETKSFEAALEMANVRNPSEQHIPLMDILEREAWVGSVWTYQEVVNSKNAVFIGLDTINASLDVTEFLNVVGRFSQKLRPFIGKGHLALRKRFPSLDTFEDLGVDWQLAGYSERSAATVMSNLDRRIYVDEKNYFYSMIGAITDTPSKSTRTSDPTTVSLAERFMSICEEKGDFSFIFTSNPRDSRADRRWSPEPSMLRSLITWHCQGERLEGVREGNGVKLKNMIITYPVEAVSPDAVKVIAEWLRLEKGKIHNTDHIIALMLAALRTMGFTGSGKPLKVALGLFFPQDEIEEQVRNDSIGSIAICISATLRYANFGAPGIAIRSINQHRTYIPGVFVGEIDRSETSDILV